MRAPLLGTTKDILSKVLERVSFSVGAPLLGKMEVLFFGPLRYRDIARDML